MIYIIINYLFLKQSIYRIPIYYTIHTLMMHAVCEQYIYYMYVMLCVRGK